MDLLIVGIALTAFLLLALAWFTLSVTGENGKNEHLLLRMIIIFFFFNLLILIPKAGWDNCYTVVANETVTDNTTAYSYDQVCFSQPTQTATIFYKQVTRLYYAFWIYIIVYVTYVILKWKGVIKGKNGKPV